MISIAKLLDRVLAKQQKPHATKIVIEANHISGKDSVILDFSEQDPIIQAHFYCRCYRSYLQQGRELLNKGNFAEGISALEAALPCGRNAGEPTREAQALLQSAENQRQPLYQSHFDQAKEMAKTNTPEAQVRALEGFRKAFLYKKTRECRKALEEALEWKNLQP